MSKKPHVMSKFSVHVTVTVAWSSSDGNAIRYVLTVLWITSCFHNGGNRPESKTTRMFRPLRQVAAPRGKSAISYCILFVKAVKLVRSVLVGGSEPADSRK